jgi:hypothetical protein
MRTELSFGPTHPQTLQATSNHAAARAVVEGPEPVLPVFEELAEGQRGTVGGHLVRVEPEGRGAGRLQIVWERQGATARIEPLLLPLQRTAGPRLRRARKLWRGLTKN